MYLLSGSNDIFTADPVHYELPDADRVAGELAKDGTTTVEPVVVRFIQLDHSVRS